MRLRRGMLRICACAVTTLCPALGAVVRTTACVVGKPTAASYTWNFHQEANQTFAELLRQARAATTTADHLAAISQDGLHEFEDNAGLLDNLAEPINNIGSEVCRLEAIRTVVAPWQQKTIDRIVVSVTLMADNTEDAIQFLNRSPEYLWSPTYIRYLDNVYHEANRLSKTLDEAVKYVSVDSRDRQLRRELGGKPTE